MNTNTNESPSGIEAEVASHELFTPTDFKTWWKSEAHLYNPMMGETVFQFAERMAEMAYGQGVIEGMDQQRMGIYPENAQADPRPKP